MTAEETLKLMAALTAAYPNTNVKEETVEIYCRFLAELPFDQAEKAVTEIISESEWFPAIAKIRKVVFENSLMIQDSYEAAINARSREGVRIVEAKLKAYREANPEVSKAVGENGRDGEDTGEHEERPVEDYRASQDSPGGDAGREGGETNQDTVQPMRGLLASVPESNGDRGGGLKPISGSRILRRLVDSTNEDTRESAD